MTEDEWIERQIAAAPPASPEQAATLARLLAEEPDPLSSPVALGRFFRKAHERGLDADFFATNPTVPPRKG